VLSRSSAGHGARSAGVYRPPPLWCTQAETRAGAERTAAYAPPDAPTTNAVPATPIDGETCSARNSQTPGSYRCRSLRADPIRHPGLARRKQRACPRLLAQPRAAARTNRKDREDLGPSNLRDDKHAVVHTPHSYLSPQHAEHRDTPLLSKRTGSRVPPPALLPARSASSVRAVRGHGWSSEMLVLKGKQGSGMPGPIDRTLTSHVRPVSASAGCRT
jgi:hypothetical protein